MKLFEDKKITLEGLKLGIFAYYNFQFNRRKRYSRRIPQIRDSKFCTLFQM